MRKLQTNETKKFDQYHMTWQSHFWVYIQGN